MIVPIKIIDDPYSSGKLIMADRNLCPKPINLRQSNKKSSINICMSYGCREKYKCRYCRSLTCTECDCSMIKTPAEKSLINRSLIHRLQVRRGLVVSLSGILRETL